MDANYTQNDLGFYRNKNDQRFSARMRYMTFKPYKNYKKITGYFFISERSRFLPKILKSRGGRAGINLTTLKLDKFGIDPAIATGPFITTGNDVIGILLFFYIAKLILLF